MSPRPLFEASNAPLVPLASVLPSVGPAVTITAAWPPPLAATPPPAVAESAPAPAVPAAPTYDPVELERRVAEVRAELERAHAEQLRAHAATVEARLVEGLARLDRAAAAGARPPAAEVVELALAAARELIGHAVTLDRDRLVATIDEALDAVRDDGPSATVRVSPDDAAWLRTNHGDRFAKLRLVEDPRLSAGGVVVETVRTVVDASMEARLDAVRHAFRAALEEAA